MLSHLQRKHIDRPDRARFVSKTFLIVLAAVLFFSTATLTAQSCPSGVTGVSVDLVRDGNGDPVILSSSKFRREHARISTGLRDALGISYDPNEEVNRQIRVIVDQPLLASGLTSTATFTVAGVFTDGNPVIEVYDREDSSDDDSGYFKLFEDATSVNLSNVQATVFATAPSSTEVTEDGVTTTDDHFCEPSGNGSYGFFERVEIDDDRRVALLVPHGGEIEQGTSEQISAFKTALTGHGIGFNGWEGDAQWDTSAASEHFHTTSDAVDPGSFPGLAELISLADFDAGQGLEFQYPVSLHGFGVYEGNGLVIGGRAHREAKCLVAREVQQRLAADGLGEVAYYIWDLDGDDTNNIDLPDERDVKITDERPDVGLSGTDRDNIVNRLSPNENGVAGHGGFQIEESRSLRDDPTLAALVAEEIADALAELITNPTIVDPDSTEICDALVAGPLTMTGDAEIGDRAWIDDGAQQGVQESGEGGLEGVSVRLYTAAGTLVDVQETNGSGNYLFTGLDAGDYSLRFDPPPGYGVTSQLAGYPDLGSDVDPTTRETGVVQLAASESDDSVDAGFVPDCHDVALVAYGSEWRFSDTETAGWNGVSFSDGGWGLKPGSLGFPDDDVTSEISVSGVTAYFRLAFEVADPQLFNGFTLTVFRDDGAAVYLNGTEVLRDNLPSGTLSATDTALSSSETTAQVTLSPNDLLAGTNVLAVEVHNVSSSSSDLVFDLELRGEVCRACVGEEIFTADRGTSLQDGELPLGGDDEIEIDGSSEKNGLLGFTLSGIPSGAEVLHAELEVRVTDSSSGIYFIHPVKRAWDETTADWDYASRSPDVQWQVKGAKGADDREGGQDATVVGQLYFPSSPVTGVVELNPTGRDLVESWLADPAANHGVTLAGSSSNGLDFDSDDHATNPPILRVVYASCGN